MLGPGGVLANPGFDFLPLVVFLGLSQTLRNVAGSIVTRIMHAINSFRMRWAKSMAMGCCMLLVNLRAHRCFRRPNLCGSDFQH